MISFIANMLRTIIFAFLLNDYLKRTYPKKYDDLLITVSFNAVYAFSVIQIKLRNAQRYILNTNPRIANLLEKYNKPRIKNVLDFVLDGNIILSTTILNSKSDINQLATDINPLPEIFDFIIYSESKSENKKLFQDVSENGKYEYELSDIRFILLEFKNGDNNYKIDLKSDAYNFYVVGNCFTKQFFIYYLKQILKINQENKDDDKYYLKIIDHNVDTVEFEFTDKNDRILLEKNGYKLLNTSDKINNEEKE